MKKAGGRRRQLTDLKKAVCCSSENVQGEEWQKNGLRGVPRVTESLGKANNHFSPTQTGSETAPLR